MRVFFMRVGSLFTPWRCFLFFRLGFLSKEYGFLPNFVGNWVNFLTNPGSFCSPSRWIRRRDSERCFIPLLGGPYSTLFEGEGISAEKWAAKRARAQARTRAGLGRFLWILGTVGSMAPFVGLFGTVVGIIKSFESIAQSGRSGFSVVAAGLSEALIATALGIGVAVVAIIFYNYLQVLLKRLDLEFRHKMEDLADQIPISRS